MTGLPFTLAKPVRKRTPPSPKALAKAGERWRPYRTIAS